MKPERAWVLLHSGRRLDLLNPAPLAWTDDDLAIGLSRTNRWAGYSFWELPLSVAQHSLTVLSLHARFSERALTQAEQRRELLHDATEALLGGWDPITPLKPHLGEGFHRLVARLQYALDTRYRLPPWDEVSWQMHKRADALAAASEALHVAGWSRQAIREDLQMMIEPLQDDPLAPNPDALPWEPWPAKVAARRFLEKLRSLSDEGCDIPSDEVSRRE